MRLFLVGFEPTYDVDVRSNVVLLLLYGKVRRRSRDDSYFGSHTHDNMPLSPLKITLVSLLDP